MLKAAARPTDWMFTIGVERVLRCLVWLYAAIVLLFSIWAWGVEIAVHQSATEHLLPGTLLTIVTMPLSMLVTNLVVSFPFLADAPFAPLAVLTLAGMVQAGGLFAVLRFLRKWE